MISSIFIDNKKYDYEITNNSIYLTITTKLTFPISLRLDIVNGKIIWKLGYLFHFISENFINYMNKIMKYKAYL
jgi:hypothetical protein